MSIDPNDIDDVGFVSESELVSDGTVAFRTDSITGISSGTISVTSSVGPLINYDDPIQAGDIVVITGNAAAGTYTVDTADFESFTVVEPIVDAGAGTVEFRHPSGASIVGVDSSGLGFTVSSTLQGALSDVDAVITPTEPCSILYSEDGVSFTQVVPLNGRGVLVNDLGFLVYKG